MNVKALIRFPVALLVVILSFVMSVIGGLARFAHDLGAGLAHLGLDTLDRWVTDLGTAFLTLVDDIEHLVTHLKRYE